MMEKTCKACEFQKETSYFVNVELFETVFKEIKDQSIPFQSIPYHGRGIKRG